MPSTLSMFLFLLGSVVYGFAVGFAMHGAPAYIGEMSPASIRGFMVSAKEAMVVAGMVFGYGLGWALNTTVGGWKYLFLFSGCVSIVQYVGTLSLPDSARYLALQGKYKEAEASARFVSPELNEGDKKALSDIVQRFKEAEDQDVDSKSGINSYEDHPNTGICGKCVLYVYV